MKYKLPRPVINQEINKVVSKAIRKQKIAIIRATKKNLKEMAALVEIIKQEGLPKYFVCKKLPKELGYGIFLHPEAKPILKGQIISSYAGEVSLTPQNLSDDSSYTFAPLYDIIFTKEEQMLFDRDRPFHPKRLYSLNIDAEKNGNFTRFINHSNQPNVTAELVRVPKNSYGLTPSSIEVVYMAKKTIRPGEQLLVSYEGEENSYWGAMGIKPVLITPKTLKLSPSLELTGSIE